VTAVLLAGTAGVMAFTHVRPRVDHACTLVGCGDFVAVELRLSQLQGKPAEVRVCLGDRCQTATLKSVDNQPRHVCGGGSPPTVEVICEAGSGWAKVVVESLLVPLPGAVPHPRIRVVVTQGGADLTDHSIQARFDARHPNGPTCGPTCYSIGLRETGTDLVVVSLDSIARHQQGLGS
jgi:hypothetical protein